MFPCVFFLLGVKYHLAHGHGVSAARDRSKPPPPRCTVAQAVLARSVGPVQQGQFPSESTLDATFRLIKQQGCEAHTLGVFVDFT